MAETVTSWSMEQWDNHRRHREQVIADTGQWIGLLNNWGIPMGRMASQVAMSAPETLRGPGSRSVTVRVLSPQGVVHPIVSELVADGLGVDDNGAMIPIVDEARLVMMERAGGTAEARRIFKVVPAELSGDGLKPSLLTIQGTEELDFLSAITAPSVPESWSDGDWFRADRDWANVPYSKPLLIQDVRFAAVATGFVKKGPAETVIRGIITQSLDAVFQGMDHPEVMPGISATPPLIVDQTPTGRPSPPVMIRLTDESIWDTVSAHAAAAGVVIRARFRLPGDPWGPQVTHPTIVVTVEQEA